MVPTTNCIVSLSAAPSRRSSAKVLHKGYDTRFFHFKSRLGGQIGFSLDR